MRFFKTELDEEIYMNQQKAFLIQVKKKNYVNWENLFMY